MLRIAVRTDEQGFVDLDVQDLSVSLSFEFADIANIGKNKAPHSLSFALPFSEQNDLAFAGYRDLASVDVDIRRSVDCIVYEGSNEILVGVINIMSIDLQARKYKCAIYGKAADVYDKLRDARWLDIFTNTDGTVFQGLDHEKTADNIYAGAFGQDITQGQLGWRRIFYPLQFTGLQRNWGSADDFRAITEQALMSTSWQSDYYGKWTARSHVFGVQVEYLLEKVFEYCGLTLVKNYVFDQAEDDRPNFDKMYYMTNEPNQTYRPYYGSDCPGQQFTSLSGGVPPAPIVTTSINMSGSMTEVSLAPIMTFASNATFDPDGFISIAGFTVPVTGTFNFSIDYEWTRTAGSSYDSFQIGVQPYDSSNLEAIGNPIWQGHVAANSSATGTGQAVFTRTLEAGQRMNFKLFWNYIAGSTTINIAAEDVRFRFLSYQGVSQVVVVPQSMGEESVGEWLEEVMRRYNLVLNADANAGTATFLMRSELYDTNTTKSKDWSDKVDRTKPVTLSSNLDEIKRKLTFQHSLGDNNFDEYWDATYARPWDRQVWNSNKQYANGEEVIGEYFQQAKWITAPDSIGEAGFEYDNNIEQYYKPKMLNMFRNLDWNDAYWTIELTGDNRFFVYRGVTVGFPDTPYFMFDNSEAPEATEMIRHDPALPALYGNLLSWARKTSYQGLFDTNSSEGFYTKYYEQEVREKYSIDTRILECEMYLTGSDLATTSWGSIIRIDLQYYYVESIRDYYVGSNKPSKVRLRRLLTSSTSGNVVGAACTLPILTYEVDCFGIVTFFDRYGEEIETINEACCAQLGGGEWFWDANQEICSTGETCDGPIGGDIAVAVSRYINTGGEDFAFDPNQRKVSLRDSDVITWTMAASTKGTATAYASNSVGVTLLPLPQNANVGFNVAYIANNTSEADRGDVEFGTWTGVVRTKDFVGDKAGADDQTSRIGDVSPLTVGVETTSVDGQAYARVYCAGMDADWTLDITATCRLTPRGASGQVGLNTEDDTNLLYQNGFMNIGLNL